jgi:hypothetical protein
VASRGVCEGLQVFRTRNENWTLAEARSQWPVCVFITAGPKLFGGFFSDVWKNLTPKSPLFASLEKLERCSPEFVPEFESCKVQRLSLYRGGKSDGVPSRALPGEQPRGQWQTRKSRRRALPGEDRRYGDRGRRYGES